MANKALKAISYVLKFPLWILAVFSWSKTFKNNPIIGSYWLNVCGLHLLRIILSQLLFRYRLLLLSPLITAEDRRNFIRNGYVLKHNFLSADAFQRLVTELQGYQGPVRELVEGTTLTQRAFMDAPTREQMPELKAFTQMPTLDRLMRYCSSKNRAPLFYIENLCNKAKVVPEPDPQRDMHADTFHPCVKGWLFVDAASDNNGPHIYVPGSHRLSWRRLKWEYQQSLEACKKGTDRAPGRYWDGSFRVSNKDLSTMGFAPRKFCVPANTLLIANVYGFHRRGEARMKSNRMTIWMQARDNPFNPLFTLRPKAASRVFEWLWGRVVKHQDKNKSQACIKYGFNRHY